ncbi:unnamed protein product [Eruca vesicaria subsp. sativa]|uniref:Uncharacterized protein n=1 Tax=Eruca vesicaria subsp. sativa TaxID=29727 RepID=A0ABC8LYP0_ERUVS|nr:unnamed protein product [Eruca vesicaria subsp. sativa]
MNRVGNLTNEVVITLPATSTSSAEPKITGKDNSFSSYGASGTGKYDQKDCYGWTPHEDNNMYSGNGDYSGFGAYEVDISLNVAYTFIPSNLMHGSPLTLHMCLIQPALDNEALFSP